MKSGRTGINSTRHGFSSSSGRFSGPTPPGSGGRGFNTRSASDLSKLTPPKPVVVVPGATSQSNANSKRCGASGISLHGWAISTNRGEDSSTTNPVDIGKSSLATEGLAALLRAAENEGGKNALTNGKGKAENHSIGNRIDKLNYDEDDYAESQAFPTLNAVKLHEERAKEEQRARYEARRLQQLQKHKEGKEEKQEEEAQSTNIGGSSTQISPDSLSSPKFNNTRPVSNDNSKDLDGVDDLPEPPSVASLTAALSSNIASGPTFTIRSAPHQHSSGKDGGKHSQSVWSSGQTSSTPSRESELVTGSSGDHTALCCRNSQKSPSAFPGLDEAVTLISQQEKEEARNRKRVKEGPKKQSAPPPVNKYEDPVFNIPKSLSSTLDSPGIRLGGAMRWADAAVDDDDDDDVDDDELLSSYQTSSHNHSHNGGNGNKFSTTAARPEAGRSLRALQTKPLTGIMSQFFSVRPLQPLAAPLEPLTYKLSSSAIQREDPSENPQFKPPNQLLPVAFNSLSPRPFQSSSCNQLSPSNNEPFSVPSRRSPIHHHHTSANVKLCDARPREFCPADRLPLDGMIPPTQSCHYGGRSGSNEPWRDAVSRQNSISPSSSSTSSNPPLSAALTGQHISYETNGRLIPTNSSLLPFSRNSKRAKCSEQLDLKRSQGLERQWANNECSRTVAPPPPPPPQNETPTFRAKLFVDKTEILRKMEERRLDEEARVREQEEASKRKLHELEERLRLTESGHMKLLPASATKAPVMPVPDTLPTFKFSHKKSKESAEDMSKQTIDKDDNEEYEIPIPNRNAPLKDLLDIPVQTISVVSGDAIDECRQLQPLQQKGSTWGRTGQDGNESQSASLEIKEPTPICKGIRIKEGYDTTGIRWIEKRQSELPCLDLSHQLGDTRPSDEVSIKTSEPHHSLSRDNYHEIHSGNRSPFTTEQYHVESANPFSAPQRKTFSSDSLMEINQYSCPFQDTADVDVTSYHSSHKKHFELAPPPPPPKASLVDKCSSVTSQSHRGCVMDGQWRNTIPASSDALRRGLKESGNGICQTVPDETARQRNTSGQESLPEHHQCATERRNSQSDWTPKTSQQSSYPRPSDNIVPPSKISFLPLCQDSIELDRSLPSARRRHLDDVPVLSNSALHCSCSVSSCKKHARLSVPERNEVHQSVRFGRVQNELKSDGNQDHFIRPPTGRDTRSTNECDSENRASEENSTPISASSSQHVQQAYVFHPHPPYHPIPYSYPQQPASYVLKPLFAAAVPYAPTIAPIDHSGATTTSHPTPTSSSPQQANHGDSYHRTSQSTNVLSPNSVTHSLPKPHMRMTDSVKQSFLQGNSYPSSSSSKTHPPPSQSFPRPSTERRSPDSSLWSMGHSDLSNAGIAQEIVDIWERPNRTADGPHYSNDQFDSHSKMAVRSHANTAATFLPSPAAQVSICSGNQLTSPRSQQPSALCNQSSSSLNQVERDLHLKGDGDLYRHQHRYTDQAPTQQYQQSTAGTFFDHIPPQSELPPPSSSNVEINTEPHYHRKYSRGSPQHEVPSYGQQHDRSSYNRSSQQPQSYQVSPTLGHISPPANTPASYVPIGVHPHRSDVIWLVPGSADVDSKHHYQQPSSSSSGVIPAPASVSYQSYVKNLEYHQAPKAKSESLPHASQMNHHRPIDSHHQPLVLVMPNGEASSTAGPPSTQQVHRYEHGNLGLRTEQPDRNVTYGTHSGSSGGVSIATEGLLRRNPVTIRPFLQSDLPHSRPTTDADYTESHSMHGNRRVREPQPLRHHSGTGQIKGIQSPDSSATMHLRSPLDQRLPPSSHNPQNNGHPSQQQVQHLASYFHHPQQYRHCNASHPGSAESTGKGAHDDYPTPLLSRQYNASQEEQCRTTIVAKESR